MDPSRGFDYFLEDDFGNVAFGVDFVPCLLMYILLRDPVEFWLSDFYPDFSIEDLVASNLLF